MSRVASSLYDGHFQSIEPSPMVNHMSEPALNIVRLNNNLATNIRGSTRTPEEWTSIFPSAAFFEGRDIKLGDIVIMVYEDPDSNRISTVMFSALGEMFTNSLTLDARSRFFVACENLTPDFRNSNVRRALAITLLKAYSAYNSLDLTALRSSKIPVAREWDQTVAGELASQMKVITTKSPVELGKQLLAFGFLQQQFTDSTTLDVIYSDSADVIDANNKLVFLLGQQLEHLFDPLTEYSPESTDVIYKPPENLKNTDDELSRSICRELFQLQESITTQLVKFLREVVIPTRIKALSGKIPELSAAKVNKIFPPTIDEVTRVNCIFFEALKTAIPAGSYEVMKACGCTIPYFYKAYMRHESALKSFSKDQSEFLGDHSTYLPPAYSTTLISSIMKVPLNLTKIKLILQRLLSTKQWSYLEEPMVQKFYSCSIETIDSFGKDDLKPYNRRVFTPTGKILTEICTGWPAMLAYGWLNRKVINVFDVKDNSDGTSGIVVLFNDYIIFASIDEESIDESHMKPKISDVLMNSLMNENPIKNTPNMKVTNWTELGSLEVLAFGENNVRIIFQNDPEASMSLSVESSSKFIGLVNKAKILGKSTPFHLFKNEKFGLSIFATAHEQSIYEREQSRSRVALFLNIGINEALLDKYNLFCAIGAKFTDDDMVSVTAMTSTGERVHHTINSSELAGFLSEEMCSLEAGRRSVHNSDLFVPLALANRSLLRRSSLPAQKHESRMSSRAPSSTLSRNISQRTRDTSVSSRRHSSLSSVNINKPLPKIIDKHSTEKEKNVPKKKSSKLKNRLSQIFGLKMKKKSTEPTKTSQRNPSHSSSSGSSFRQPLTTLQSKFEKPKSVPGSKNASLNFNSTAPASDVRGDKAENTPEVSINDDYKTFESSLSPIFDDDLPELNVQTIAESSTNWVLTRDNSSVNCNLNKMTQLNNSNLPVHQELRETSHSPNTKSIDHCTGLFGQQGAAGPPLTQTALTAQRPKQQPTLRVIKTPVSTPVPRNLTFRSIDDEFTSPVLRVGVHGGSVDDMATDEDIFYTPKSYRIDTEFLDNDGVFKDIHDGNMFGSFDVDTSMNQIDYKPDAELGGDGDDGVNDDDGDDDEGGEEEATRWSAGGNEHIDGNIKVKVEQPPAIKEGSSDLYDSASVVSSRVSSFKSCMDDNQLIRVLKDETDDDVDDMFKSDESFRYLARMLDEPFLSVTMNNSETYQTLPRSFSSHKYLAAFIDNDENMSKDLYEFLQAN